MTSKVEKYILEKYTLPYAMKKYYAIKAGKGSADLHDWSVYVIELQYKLLNSYKESLQ